MSTVEQYDTETQVLPQPTIISQARIVEALDKLKHGQNVQQLHQQPQFLQFQNITIPQPNQQHHLQIHQQGQFEIPQSQQQDEQHQLIIRQNPQDNKQNPILNVNIPHELHAYMMPSGTKRIPTKLFNHYLTIINKVNIFISFSYIKFFYINLPKNYLIIMYFLNCL